VEKTEVTRVEAVEAKENALGDSLDNEEEGRKEGEGDSLDHEEVAVMKEEEAARKGEESATVKTLPHPAHPALPRPVFDGHTAALINLCRDGGSGDVDEARDLIAQGINIDEQDGDQCTALISASRYGYIGVVKELVLAGAALHLQCYEGMTAAEWAQERGHTSIVNALSDAERKAEAANAAKMAEAKAAEAKAAEAKAAEAEAAVVTGLRESHTTLVSSHASLLANALDIARLARELLTAAAGEKAGERVVSRIESLSGATGGGGSSGGGGGGGGNPSELSMELEPPMNKLAELARQRSGTSDIILTLEESVNKLSSPISQRTASAEVAADAVEAAALPLQTLAALATATTAEEVLAMLEEMREEMEEGGVLPGEMGEGGRMSLAEVAAMVKESLQDDATLDVIRDLDTVVTAVTEQDNGLAGL
jgi:ankyrin repeat protein